MRGFTADVSQPVLLEFIKALIVCANADGTPETLTEPQDYASEEDIQEAIERGRHLGTAHRPVVYDSIRACSADGDLSHHERTTILKMAAEAGMTDEELAEFERIHAEDRALRERRTKVVFPVATPS